MPVATNAHHAILVPGEIFELKAELNNEKKEKRKEAVKKVIAAMTVGKDVRYVLGLRPGRSGLRSGFTVT